MCLAGVFEDGSEQKCHEERSSTGIIIKMRRTSFFNVSVPNIYGTSSSAYLIIFLKVISKVLFFNITQKFSSAAVDHFDLFVGTYRLSSHARLEAFVIQTKLNFGLATGFTQLPLRCPPQTYIDNNVTLTSHTLFYSFFFG
jgi:hypothetical protein